MPHVIDAKISWQLLKAGVQNNSSQQPIKPVVCKTSFLGVFSLPQHNSFSTLLPNARCKVSLKKRINRACTSFFIICSDAQFYFSYRKVWRLLSLTSIKISGVFLSACAYRVHFSFNPGASLVTSVKQRPKDWVLCTQAWALRALTVEHMAKTSVRCCHWRYQVLHTEVWLHKT